MKTLILYRHAKSDWSVPGQRDIDRTLNKRGKSDAPIMAAVLAGLVKDAVPLVLCSTARRTKETLKPLSDRLPPNTPVVFENGLYESGGAAYLEIIKTISPKYDTVIIIGHNPSIEECVDYLAGGEETFNSITVPTGTIVVMDVRVNNWKNSGAGMASIKSVLTPKLIKKINSKN